MRWPRRDHLRWDPPEPMCAFVVLAEPEALPAMHEIVNPAGEHGAVVAAPAKIGEGTVVEGDGVLEQRIQLGDGFCAVSGSGAIVTVALAADVAADPARVEVALHGSGSAVGAAVLFVTSVADRIAALTGGLVEDIVSQRSFRAGEWRVPEPIGAIDVREHAVIHLVDDDATRTAWAHTHGLLKFGRPELELRSLPASLTEAATAALLDVAQYVAEGALIAPGHTLGARANPILAAVAHDDEHWHGVPVLELVDAVTRRPGAPAGLGAWATSTV